MKDKTKVKKRWMNIRVSDIEFQMMADLIKKGKSISETMRDHLKYIHKIHCGK